MSWAGVAIDQDKKAVSSIANLPCRLRWRTPKNTHTSHKREKEQKKLKRDKEYKVFFGLCDEKNPNVVG